MQGNKSLIFDDKTQYRKYNPTFLSYGSSNGINSITLAGKNIVNQWKSNIYILIFLYFSIQHVVSNKLKIKHSWDIFFNKFIFFYISLSYNCFF